MPDLTLSEHCALLVETARPMTAALAHVYKNALDNGLPEPVAIALCLYIIDGMAKGSP